MSIFRSCSSAEVPRSADGLSDLIAGVVWTAGTVASSFLLLLSMVEQAGIRGEVVEAGATTGVRRGREFESAGISGVLMSGVIPLWLFFTKG